MIQAYLGSNTGIYSSSVTIFLPWAIFKVQLFYPMLKKNCAPSPRNFRVPRFVGAFRAQFQLETFFSCLRHTIFSKSKQKTANFKKCRNQYSAPFLPEGTNFLWVERPLIVFQNFSSHCNHQLRVAHTKYLIYIIIVYLSLYVEHILLAL